MIHNEIDRFVVGNIRIIDGGFERDYCFSESFIGFNGHFPGQPILPAIVQVMVACRVISQQYGMKLEIASISRAKFQKIVGPDMLIVVKCTVTPKEDGFQCRCSLQHEGDSVAKFVLFLNEMDNSNA